MDGGGVPAAIRSPFVRWTGIDFVNFAVSMGIRRNM
jgi:hypothetical protein